MKTKQISTVQDVFKQFCKERHAEDKGRNYNLLQEVYANTELFDLSNIEVGEEYLINPKELVTYDIIEDDVFSHKELKEDDLYYYNVYENVAPITLPFSSCFVYYYSINKVASYVMVREFSPTILSGTAYLVLEKEGTVTKGNIPFQFFTETNKLRMLRKDKNIIEHIYNNIENSKSEEIDEDDKFHTEVTVFPLIMDTLITLSTLSSRTVVADKVENPKTEYFPRKNGLATIKREQSPIYYVLNKSEEKKPKAIKNIKSRGKLEFTHSFKVRSHWRRLHNPNTLGKNRNGEYIVKGMTFVRESVRGKGELAKRLRIVI